MRIVCVCGGVQPSREGLSMLIDPRKIPESLQLPVTGDMEESWQRSQREDSSSLFVLNPTSSSSLVCLS